MYELGIDPSSWTEVKHTPRAELGYLKVLTEEEDTLVRHQVISSPNPTLQFPNSLYPSVVYPELFARQSSLYYNILPRSSTLRRGVHAYQDQVAEANRNPGVAWPSIK